MTIPNSEGFFSAEICLPLAPDEEKAIVKELTRASEANPKEGDLFYVISNRWWREWQEYVGFDRINDLFMEHSHEGYLHNPHRPGKIDNSELLLEESDGENNDLDLQKDLQERVHYTLVSGEVWKKLLEWYKGGPELPRKLISIGRSAKNLIVEVYLMRLHVTDARNNSQRTIRISRTALVSELYDMVCTLLDVEKDKVCIWDYFHKNRHARLGNFDQTLEEAQLLMDQEILLEEKADDSWTSSFSMDVTGNELALVPVGPSMSPISIAGGPNSSNGCSQGFGSHFQHLNNFGTAHGDVTLSNGIKVDDRGLTGLHNLGNTCFMNSAIQCLVHTAPLVEFFLQDYTAEINSLNPLGMRGELAIEFGELLRKLWSAGRTSLAPRTFKAKLARFAPQFSGYNQHDSQELLAFLLDGLHEDLNRVINKPYIESKDANGRPDEEFADECWKNHKARNDSIIVDICQGQYKSTLICPDCSKVSVTFDPFMYLSLPLPSMVTRMMTATVFSGEGNTLPTPFTVTVPTNGCCRDLVRALSTASCLSSFETLLLAEVFNGRIYRYLDNPFEHLSTIKNDDYIVAYRLPPNHDTLLRLEIFHHRSERYKLEPQHSMIQRLSGTPLMTCLPAGLKNLEEIQSAVSSVLAPLLRTKAHSPSPSSSSEDNLYGPSLDNVALTDNGSCSSEDLSTSSTVVENMSNELPFKIALTDDKCNIQIPIDKDPKLLSGSCVRILLDWSERECHLYNFDFLENLPLVYKPKKTRLEPVSLYSCLEAFLKEEPLGPDDMWYCPSCKEHRQATKKLDLWRLPEILVVHLKRFSYSRFLKNKIDTFVNYPLRNLDLSKYIKLKSATPGSHVYDLYAVSNHYGGLGGGHYSAYAKLIDDDSWHHFDDSHVTRVTEDAVKTPAAYVLFYRRVKDDARMDTDPVPTGIYDGNM